MYEQLREPIWVMPGWSTMKAIHLMRDDVVQGEKKGPIHNYY